MTVNRLWSPFICNVLIQTLHQTVSPWQIGYFLSFAYHHSSLLFSHSSIVLHDILPNHSCLHHCPIILLERVFGCLWWPLFFEFLPQCHLLPLNFQKHLTFSLVCLQLPLILWLLHLLSLRNWLILTMLTTPTTVEPSILPFFWLSHQQSSGHPCQDQYHHRYNIYQTISQIHPFAQGFRGSSSLWVI